MLASEKAPRSRKALSVKRWGKTRRFLSEWQMSLCRIATSWMAEAKAKKLTPLEVLRAKSKAR